MEGGFENWVDHLWEGVDSVTYSWSFVYILSVVMRRWSGWEDSWRKQGFGRRFFSAGEMIGIMNLEQFCRH